MPMPDAVLTPTPEPQTSVCANVWTRGSRRERCFHGEAG